MYIAIEDAFWPHIFHLPRAMKIENDIARAVREFRDVLDLAQTSLGMDQAYVSRVESGKRTPTLAKIEEIAECLGVHPLAILTAAYVETHAEWRALDKVLQSQLKAVLRR
ncbi:TPA: XRE family transcriptional regulator [Pseudomonas aeruginosa]|nr:XRE family transcriptional regulator [Pseudomonas aeruginosa]